MNPNEKNSFDDLFDAWQRESRRVDSLAAEHPVAAPPVGPRVRRHPRWWTMAGGWLRIAVCLLALVWLVAAAHRYVVDTLDLVAHLIVAFLLLYALVSILHSSLLMLRHRLAVATLPLHHFALTLAIAATFIVVATPAYAGRAMALPQGASRTATLDAVQQMRYTSTQIPA